MSKWVVLADLSVGGTSQLRQGQLLDDVTDPVNFYIAQGVPLMLYQPVQHAEPLALFNANRNAGVPLVSYLFGASPTEDILDGSIQIVWVSGTGSDVTGDGSQGKPWATVLQAFRMIPHEWRGDATHTPTYIVRVVAPYNGPLGTISQNVLESIFIPNAGQSAAIIPRIIVQAWSPTIGGLSDTRFTVIAGPLTPSSVTTFGGSRSKYVMAGGTITSNDQHTGRMVRIFNAAGTEVARGSIIRCAGAAPPSGVTAQELLCQVNQTYTPAASDQIYIVEPSVVLGGIVGGASADISQIRGIPAPMSLRFETIKFTDAINVGMCTGTGPVFVQCMLVANGGSGSLNVLDAVTTVSLLGNVLAGLSLADGTLIAGTIMSRSNGAFVGQGNIAVNAGCAIVGNFRPSTGQGGSGLTLTGNCTFRGTLDGTIPKQGAVTLSGGTSGLPVLLIHFATTNLIVCHQGCRGSHSGVVAVDANVSTGHVVDVLEAIWSSNTDQAIGTFVPADATTTLAAGQVVNVQANGSARVNTTSTLVGAGAADVKAGANAGITFAALAALSPQRSTDAVALAQVST